MVKWIMWCVSTSSVLVMVNGVPCEPFRMNRGLRQVDPISSFLFNIVDEPLNFVINKPYSKGLISGIHVGENRVQFTHLQYADDTILFILKDSTTVINYRRLLECFRIMTGLEIRFSKSSLITWNNKRDLVQLEDMASILQCKTHALPFKYLGVFIGGNPRGANI